MLTYIVGKEIENEFSLTLGKLYMLCVHVLYPQCSKLPFNTTSPWLMHECTSVCLNSRLGWQFKDPKAHSKQQLRLSDN